MHGLLRRPVVLDDPGLLREVRAMADAAYKVEIEALYAHGFEYLSRLLQSRLVAPGVATSSRADCASSASQHSHSHSQPTAPMAALASSLESGAADRASAREVELDEMDAEEAWEPLGHLLGEHEALSCDPGAGEAWRGQTARGRDADGDGGAGVMGDLHGDLGRRLAAGRDTGTLIDDDW